MQNDECLRDHIWRESTAQGVDVLDISTKRDRKAKQKKEQNTEREIKKLLDF